MAFPTPPLPTDNLYKLVAIGGGALLITCMVLVFQGVKEIDEQSKEWVETMFEGVDAATGLLEPPESADWFLSSGESSIQKEPFEERSKQFDSWAAEAVVSLTKRLKEKRPDTSNEEIEATQQAITKLKKSVLANRRQLRAFNTLVMMSWIYFWTGILGIVLLVSGFALWWWRGQLLQDQILKSEAAEAMPAKSFDMPG